MIYLSLFHGIGAVDLAWLPLGWRCAAYAEIEPFPIAVTKHHNPNVPNLGDVTKITDEQIAALGPIDLVVGGSPCQDLSVAGKRAGLAGERSGLFHEQMRIFHAARALCGARWLLWENVPGAFSSHGGRDFGVVVGSMAGCELGVPRGGWGTCGAAIGANGLVEWRTLDAQYVRVESHPAAVPQRRRRVFALLDSGAWADRPPILLEPEGLQGNPAPRRETGEGIAGGIAGSLGVRGNKSHTELDGHGASVVHSLRAEAFGGNNTSGSIDVGTACNAHGGSSGRIDFESETFVLERTGGVFDEAIGFAQNQRDEVRECAVAGALAAEPGMKQQTYIAFGQQNSARQGASASASASVTPTLDKSKVPGVGYGMQVRRLTPRECERLQGFPDDYTLIEVRGKPAADGPRYRALGNSMAVNCMRWIGERIATVASEGREA